MKLSIITINYNNASGLQKTMESVFTQTSHDFEYILVDGNSTDGSIEIIQRFNNSTIQHFSWISEPDTGIYNAMNKGIRMAKGEYVHFLNSGDWLVDSRVVENMLKTLDYNDILVGNVISVRPDGKVRYKKNTKKVSLMTFYRSTIEHTSAYIRRALFDQYGLYDENLKIASDWKWYMNVVGFHNAKVGFANTYVTYFDMTGISSINKQLDKEERRKILEELIPAPILVDYDHYAFDIEQMERLKRYPLLYRLVWFIERCLFKLDKWEAKYWGWKKIK
jgi:glycosyltransferase involved in cell wall biosynthesis